MLPVTPQLTSHPTSSPDTQTLRTPSQLKSDTSNSRATHVMCRSTVTRRASLKCDSQKDDCFPAALVGFCTHCTEDHTEEMAPLHQLTIK